ncbi:MAG: hypothetical protein M1816_000704 [Peltula sp. TS41687]|nr:MAG: hypothetical protein M1816_000704 [Peltula sp. TS41687]
MDQNLGSHEKHAKLLTRDAGLAMLCKRLNQTINDCAAVTEDADLARRTELVGKMENAIDICMAYLRLKQKKWLSRGGVKAVKAMTTQERLHLREEGSFFHDLLREKTQVKIFLAGLEGKSATSNHTLAIDKRQVLSTRRLLKPRRRWLKEGAFMDEGATDSTRKIIWRVESEKVPSLILFVNLLINLRCEVTIMKSTFALEKSPLLFWNDVIPHPDLVCP